MIGITLKAYGKVNLSLNITGVKENMHTLESVMCCIDVYDTVTVELNRCGKTSVRFKNLSQRIPLKNSVTKAVNFLKEVCPDIGANVTVEKGIPLAGGLGGSSADAAAVIRAACVLMPEIFDKADVLKKSVKIGSDVPALTSGGCSLISGVGEEVKKISAPSLHIVTVCGDGGVNSADAYRLFDKIYPEKKFCPAHTSELISALSCGDLNRIASCTFNALTKPACMLCGEISGTLQAVSESGAKAVFMTGSGNCCCGIYGDKREAASAAETLSKRFKWARYTPTISAEKIL